MQAYKECVCFYWQHRGIDIYQESGSDDNGIYFKKGIVLKWDIKLEIKYWLKGNIDKGLG